MVQVNVVARHVRTEKTRNFLIECADPLIAKSLFMVEYPTWEPEGVRTARCFSSGEHSGPLSVWEGQEGKTAVLCQHHGENPPTAN